LLTAFLTRMSPSLAIGLSGCLFGLFHVIATLSFERFIPTFFLGLVLGWVCHRTGSVFPGMVLHTIHNALILLMHAFVKELTALGIGAETDQRVPIPWLVVAAIVVVSTGFLFFERRENSPAVVTSSEHGAH
jgi:sodium transport system permease protein